MIRATKLLVDSKPAAPMVDVLALIWQQLLQRQSISLQDNFFDLGGTPAQAVKMFSELTQITGRDLTPVTILHTPTIATLAHALEQPAPLRLPVVVPMKAGNAGPPVFIAAGLGGSILDLLPVARHVESPHPIYGLVARGVDGADEPLDRVEDMAQFYLEAIKRLQPFGPYVLIGGSFGGLVMLEIAQHLMANAEEITLLTMLDSYPHHRYLSRRQRLRLLRRRATNRLSILAKLPPRDALSYIARRLRGRITPSGTWSQQMADRMAVGALRSPTMRHLRDNDYLALANYRPQFYKGKIKFVRVGAGSHFPDDAAGVWKHLANEIVVETLPGDHREMITTHFKDLASALSRYLQEVGC